MFESDDWDLDQDFLNDVDEKAVKFYSQSDNHEIEPAKRRKVEICDDPIFSSGNNIDWSTEKSVQENTAKCAEDKMSRKDLIYGMFSKSGFKNVSSVLQKSNSVPIKSQSNSSVNNENNQLPRKNLVLGILQKKDAEEKPVQNKHCVLNNIKNINHKKDQSKVATINNIKFQQLNSAVKNNKTNCQTSDNANTSKQTNNISNNQSKQNSLEASRKQLLFDVLKPSSVNNSRIKNHAPKINSPIKINQAQPNKKMTLIRRFPGPAGLLPDDMDTSVPPVSILKTLEESENEKQKETSNSKLPEYCSQNTKNLFSEGAWQLMLDDLPNNFLKDYDIASVKQMANVNGCRSAKVQFMAGVLEYIDHSRDNPPIVLKDFTDSIQGIVHRDIPLKYPGLLEPNVVVLLHDVGLLKTSASISVNKYHILISPSSLLAIYSDKNKIVRTPYMGSILEISSYNTTEKNNHTPLTSTEAKLMITQNSKHYNSNNKQDVKNVQDSNKQSNSNTSFYEPFGSINDSINFDIMDEFSFSVSPKDITNSQYEPNFSRPTSTNIKRSSETNKQSSQSIAIKKTGNVEKSEGKSQQLLETLKKYAPDMNKPKKCSPTSKVSRSGAESTAQNYALPEKMEIEESDDVLLKLPEPISDKLNIRSNSIRENIPSNTNQPKNKLSVRSRLLQFQSDDVLVPPESENLKISNSNASSTSSSTKDKSQNDNTSFKSTNSFQDILRKDGNDSDDEMLSQLDVDTIFSNYNQEN